MANMVHCEQTTWTTLLISNVSCHVLGSFPLMSTPTMALPSSPLHIEGTCKPLHTSLTNYSPPALWHWVHSQDLQPTKSTIDAEWHKHHLDIYKDNLSYTSPTTFLHPHFCLNSVDRSLTYHEGISDIWDAVSTYIHHTSSLADFCLQGCCNGLPTSYISVSPFGLSGIHQCQYIGPTFTLRPLHQGCLHSFLAGLLSQRRLPTLCGKSLLCPMSCMLRFLPMLTILEQTPLFLYKPLMSPWHHYDIIPTHDIIITSLWPHFLPMTSFFLTMTSSAEHYKYALILSCNLTCSYLVTW